MNRALSVLVLAIALTACGCGGDSSGSASNGGVTSGSSARACKSLVGQPLSQAWDDSAQQIKCVDASGQVPAAWQSSGCYPGGNYDKSTPMISFSSDNGFYFGRTGENLMFKTGTPTMSQMSKAAGC